MSVAKEVENHIIIARALNWGHFLGVLSSNLYTCTLKHLATF